MGTKIILRSWQNVNIFVLSLRLVLQLIEICNCANGLGNPTCTVTTNIFVLFKFHKTVVSSINGKNKETILFINLFF